MSAPKPRFLRDDTRRAYGRRARRASRACTTAHSASSSRRPPQLSKRREVPEIRGGLGLLRRLQHLRHARERTAVLPAPERTKPEEATADVLVAVESRAEPRARVVQVEGQDPPPPHRRLAFGHRPAVSGLGAQIVAGGEEMTRVHAHAETLGPGRAINEGRQLAERPAETVAAARGVLERDLHPIAGRATQRLVERGGHPAQPDLEPGAHVRAGTDHHARALPGRGPTRPTG